MELTSFLLCRTRTRHRTEISILAVPDRYSCAPSIVREPNIQHLARLTAKTSPTLREGFGVGAHTKAELLILFGDNPDRIRSDAAFAKRCGRCPIPASSGMTTGRHPSIEAATDTPTPPSIETSSSACGTISQPVMTSHAARRTAEPRERSSGA